MKNSIIGLIFLLGFQNISGQDSKYLHFLVDSLPKGTPVLVNFEVEKGFMATERIAISKDGKSIYYGIRNSYDYPTSTAHILKINFTNNTWSKPQIVFADSSGAPAFSRDEKIMYFQYDHPKTPKGLYSTKTKTGWDIPKLFRRSLKKSHYLQSPRKNSYFYTAGINEEESIQDVYHVITTKSDTISKRLGFEIKGDFSDLYVSPDESFLILLINKKNNSENYKFYGNGNLFISFKKGNDTWSSPINLGKEVHNISEWNWGPYVTKDKKFLFFSSWLKTGGTYMIDFEPIYNRLKKQVN